MHPGEFFRIPDTGEQIFEAANLTDADPRGVDLRGADLRRATLSRLWLAQGQSY